MYCPYCGKQVVELESFCPYCGRQVGDVIEDDSNINEQYAQQYGQSNVKSNIGSNISSVYQNIKTKLQAKNLLAVIGIILAFTVYAIFLLNHFIGIGSGISEIFEDSHITAVKTGYPTAYPNKTYGAAFEEFFANPSWKYFIGTDENGKTCDVVEFTGRCMYADTEVTAKIQFILDNDAGTLELHYLSFNDIPQNMLIIYALMEKIFDG